MAGLEPARCFQQGIFLLLYVAIATFMRCSLDYVFTIFLRIQVAGVQSLHIQVFLPLSSALSQRDFRRISLHSLKKFPILVLHRELTNQSVRKSLVSAIPPHGHLNGVSLRPTPRRLLVRWRILRIEFSKHNHRHFPPFY